MRHRAKFKFPSEGIKWVLLLVLLPFAVRLVGLLRAAFGYAPSASEIQQGKQNDVDVIANDYNLSSRVLLADAQALSHQLGTAYSWYDPRNWTEDESRAVSIVLQYSVVTFPALESAYFVEASRSLRADLSKYLRPSQLQQISHLF